MWPGFKDIPDGWRTACKNANKEVCLTYLQEVWPGILY
ncbi:MbtH family NRPS accessory protein [Methylobacter sp.]